ncbi:hypothetical protein BDZ89DRAFT_1038424 [Hymenopellis radicata]|nr:hypothetical protein BDZ89DRAFT_1038424 [Hymenopellis radicata]
MNRKPWKYSLEKTFMGLHQDSVSCLAFSPCGQFLASCGKGRVCIYSVSRSKVIRYYDIVDASPVALTWGDTTDDLYVGYSNGHLWQYQRPTRGGLRSMLARFFPSADISEFGVLEGSILKMTWGSRSRHLFVAHGSSATVLRPVTKLAWDIVSELDRPELPYTALGFQPPAPCPVGMHISGRRNQIIVADRDYGINCYDFSNIRGIKCWDIAPGNRIGMSDVSHDCTSLAAWNLKDGLDIYTLSPSRRKYKETISLQDNLGENTNVFLDVAFIHDDFDLLVGSNVGQPVIVNLRSHHVVQKLEHSPVNCIVSIVAYTRLGNRRYIATADRELGTETTVKLWVAKTDSHLWNFISRILEGFRRVWKQLGTLFLILIVLFVDRIIIQEGLLSWHSRPIRSLLALIVNLAEGVRDLATSTSWSAKLKL